MRLWGTDPAGEDIRYFPDAAVGPTDAKVSVRARLIRQEVIPTDCEVYP